MLIRKKKAAILDEVLQTSAVLALSKELITAGQDSPQCDKCDSKMVQKTEREIKRRDETNEGEIKRREKKKKKSQNVVRQKETKGAQWRPLWQNFPECSLIAGD